MNMGEKHAKLVRLVEPSYKIPHKDINAKAHQAEKATSTQIIHHPADATFKKSLNSPEEDLEKFKGKQIPLPGLGKPKGPHSHLYGNDSKMREHVNSEWNKHRKTGPDADHDSFAHHLKSIGHKYAKVSIEAHHDGSDRGGHVPTLMIGGNKKYHELQHDEGNNEWH